MENQNPPFPPNPPQGNPYQQNPYNQNPYMQNPMGGNPMGMQQDLPNHVGVLVLGIVSIALCWCYGLPALVCGIISLVMGNKSMRMYSENPGLYSDKSYKNTKAGRICAIIGTCLSVLTMIYFIVYLVFLGAAISTLPWQNMSRY
jgi:hypothetical protein